MDPYNMSDAELIATYARERKSPTEWYGVVSMAMQNRELGEFAPRILTVAQARKLGREFARDAWDSGLRGEDARQYVKDAAIEQVSNEGWESVPSALPYEIAETAGLAELRKLEKR